MRHQDHLDLKSDHVTPTRSRSTSAN